MTLAEAVVGNKGVTGNQVAGNQMAGNQMADSRETIEAKNEKWIERLKPGAPDQEQAITELRDLLVKGLNHSLTSKYGSGLQADDVVQDALLKILASLDQFEGRSRFTTWAMTIATRVGLSELRRRHFKDVSLDAMTADGLTLPGSAEEISDLHSDQKQILDVLKSLIEDRLSDKQRVAIQGQLAGLPVEEIARRTGSNRNAVYKLVHDARIQLRNGFRERGIEAAAVTEIFA